jgi:hypothetical protein
MYVEQLLCPSDLKKYNITTRTPLPQPAEPEELPRYLRIQDNDKVIAGFLAMKGVKIPKGFTKRQALEEYAKQDRRRVVYVTVPKIAE